MKNYIVLALMAIAGAASAQVWNNGPFLTGTTTQTGVSAPTGTQWSECSFVGGVQMGTAGFNALQGSFREADDFTLTGATNLSDIHLFAYQTGSSTSPTITGGTIQIWNGRPGDVGSSVVFGDTTTNRFVSSTFQSAYRIFSTSGGNAPGTTRPIFDTVLNLGTTLNAGTYWIDVDLKGSASFSGPWIVAVTTPGQLQKAGSNSLSLAAGGAWADNIDAGSGLQQDLAFTISGQPVPEPASMAALGLGALALIRKRRNRKA